MANEIFPVNGVRKSLAWFPFDTKGRVNGRANMKTDTRRLQQIQKELRQLSLSELRGIRNDWAKPPLHVMAWIQELVPYLDGLIKERTPAIPLPRKQRESIKEAILIGLNDDLRKEVALLRQEVNALTLRFKAASPSIEWTKKALPPPRQHAKGKKRRLIGPVGELAAVTRPHLEIAVASPHTVYTMTRAYVEQRGISLQRFQSSITAQAAYFYGRGSMTSRLVRDSSGVEWGVEFQFVGNLKPIRTPRRTDTHPVSIDQSTPT